MYNKCKSGAKFYYHPIYHTKNYKLRQLIHSKILHHTPRSDVKGSFGPRGDHVSGIIKAPTHPSTCFRTATHLVIKYHYNYKNNNNKTGRITYCSTSRASPHLYASERWELDLNLRTESNLLELPYHFTPYKYKLYDLDSTPSFWTCRTKRNILIYVTPQ